MRRDELVGVLRSAGCVWAEDEADLLIAAARRSDEALAEFVARRVAGEPLEQIVGYAEFGGLRLAVEPGVFVPRRRTEFLVEVAARLLPASPSRPVVVDLCCGTGALGAALLARLDTDRAAAGLPTAELPTTELPTAELPTAELPTAELHAADLDPVAVRCARRNLPPSATVHEGDLFEALPSTLRGQVDAVLANAPYVPTAEIELLPAEARRYEHRLALDGGVDGLALHRRIIAAAGGWLAPGGVLLIEVTERQRPAATGLLRDAGLQVAAHESEVLEALVLTASR